MSEINPDYPITKEFKNASDEFEIVGGMFEYGEVIGNIYENPKNLKDTK